MKIKSTKYPYPGNADYHGWYIPHGRKSDYEKMCARIDKVKACEHEYQVEIGYNFRKYERCPKCGASRWTDEN